MITKGVSSYIYLKIQRHYLVLKSVLRIHLILIRTGKKWIQVISLGFIDFFLTTDNIQIFCLFFFRLFLF